MDECEIPPVLSACISLLSYCLTLGILAPCASIHQDAVPLTWPLDFIHWIYCHGPCHGLWLQGPCTLCPISSNLSLFYVCQIGLNYFCFRSQGRGFSNFSDILPQYIGMLKIQRCLQTNPLRYLPQLTIIFGTLYLEKSMLFPARWPVSYFLCMGKHLLYPLAFLSTL